MEFFIGPVQVLMKFQKLNGWYGRKNVITGPLEATTSLHSVAEGFTNRGLNTKVDGEVQPRELSSIKTINSIVHLVKLGLGIF
jgi:hypothetical protein